MPTPRKVNAAVLTLQLQAQGPMTAQVLAAVAGADRSRISRALSTLGSSVIRLGVTRGARYALRRTVRGLGHTFPIRRIDERGGLRDWAELTALHGGWRVVWASASRAPAWSERVLDLGGWSEGFPFFLGDVRPQGYLGRAVARRLPTALGLGLDPRSWGDDETLVFLAAEGDDLPGNLIVGDEPAGRFQARRLIPVTGLAELERTSLYPQLVLASQVGGSAGSSVEGEQPKFTATLATSQPEVGIRPVIVKFTDAMTSSVGRRWADLLVAEAHALEVLHGAGEVQTVPRVFDAGGRRFLEMERFDRFGSQGRRGVASLRALHEAFGTADTNDWTVAAAGLMERGLLTTETMRSIQLRHMFGSLIGNTDMHFGNLAFWLDDAVPFSLAPTYDMLPMLWAPGAGGELVPRALSIRPPLPAQAAHWRIAAGWARAFWALVADDSRVSQEFAVVAREAGRQVEQALGCF
ncbi:MAG: type II toxin-antitoxin system HipA family toxin YjjJ [Verrucomicrobia bacterium]|nr:type II toxin-antitoxin system HipA family toxin YjjJ [Verrucomicrobiota bacterium]